MEGQAIRRAKWEKVIRSSGGWVSIAFVVLLPLYWGCEQPQPPAPTSALPAAEEPKKTVEPAPPFTASGYTATRIEILPLTELVDAPKGEQGTQLKVYVSLLDSFGSQIKSPGVFRFEVYTYVQRSAQPKGQRIAIWPDIDLTDPSENQKYWRDFLRAYEFTLTDQAPPKKGTYVLEATCMCPEGKRLSDEFILKPES
jgi:hypothetical protein